MTNDKAELLSAAVVIGVGIFGLYLAYSIESFQEETLVGPRLVPMTITGLGIGLGILQLALSWMNQIKNDKAGDSTIADANRGKRPALSLKAVLRMAAVIVIGFAYIWLFSATGYLIATAAAMAVLLVLFGTRNGGKVAVLTIGGTTVYYIIFIRLMGIYNPPGWLLNLEMLGL
jgi:hypothetical protein